MNSQNWKPPQSYPVAAQQHEWKRESCKASGGFEQEPSTQTALTILAAGAATRMGSIKQLLPYGGGTLLSHAIAEAQNSGFHRVAVVLGAYADQIEPVVRATGAEIVLNPDWETGMGSSIYAGLAHFLQGSDTLEIFGITLADQPYVKAAHLAAMRELLASSEAPVVAAQYASQYGVPALFRKEAFPLLLALPPQAGARQVLRNHELKVRGFPLPEAEVDVDTPADLAELHKVRP